MTEDFFHGLKPDYELRPADAGLTDARTRGRLRRRRRHTALATLTIVPLLALITVTGVTALSDDTGVVVAAPPPACTPVAISGKDPMRTTTSLKTAGGALAAATLAATAACTPAATGTAGPSPSPSASVQISPPPANPTTSGPGRETPTSKGSQAPQQDVAGDRPDTGATRRPSDGNCGAFRSKTGVTGPLLIARGSVSCAEARTLAQAYDRQGSQLFNSGGWSCSAGRAYDPELLGCEKGTDGATYFYVRKPAPRVDNTDCGKLVIDGQPSRRLVLVRGNTTCAQGKTVAEAYALHDSQLFEYGPWECAGGRSGDRAALTCGMGPRQSTSLQSAETVIELR